MKERPILFNAEMVRAILDGRKTQTRRVVKSRYKDEQIFFDPKQYAHWESRHPERAATASIYDAGDESFGPAWYFGHEDGGGGELSIQCPYGKPGDRLYVRETHHLLWFLAEDFYNDMNGEPCSTERWCQCGPDSDQDPPPVWYCADGEPPELDTDALSWGEKRPSIFLPKWASRITLEVTDVRVERVQDITEQGARAEGPPDVITDTWPTVADYHPREAFAALWDSINAKRGFGWKANPWTWVVEFKRVK